MPLNNAHHLVIQNAHMTENTNIDNQINNHTYVTNQVRSKSLSPIRNTPPSTSRNFTGQERYLKKLHEKFDKNNASGRK
ncbi:hypothetical protein BDQ17DRAFT_1377488, partial [Cyathus striatus]